MNIEPIAYFESPFHSKFGVPRQSSLAEDVEGRIVFMEKFRDPNCVRGLEEFGYIWIIWNFNLSGNWKPTVRPPRLGGNKAVGVFASRSPFRPNALGLSSVRLERIEYTSDKGPVLHVKGGDLVDGTPIFDIKPYIPYADSHIEANAGFVDSSEWEKLQVIIPREVKQEILRYRDNDENILKSIEEVLSLDPRPQYQDDPQRIYGMSYGGLDIRFKVCDGILNVVSTSKL